MQYVAFIGTGGPMPEEALAEMNRDIPAYRAQMQRRGVKPYGRELDFPETAVTVRVRDGETLVADGPFAETKEFVGGFDLLECADLDEAIEVEGKSPVARFLPFEIRPFKDGVARMGSAAPAFGRQDDSAGLPYLFTVWASPTPALPVDEPIVTREYDAWQQELEARGVFVLGNALGRPETATTLRVRDGAVQLSDGPFLALEDFIAGIDVAACADQQQAIALAAAHPMARYHAVEVRPFYSEAIHAQRRAESRAEPQG